MTSHQKLSANRQLLPQPACNSLFGGFLSAGPRYAHLGHPSLRATGFFAKGFLNGRALVPDPCNRPLGQVRRIDSGCFRTVAGERPKWGSCIGCDSTALGLLGRRAIRQDLTTDTAFRLVLTIRSSVSRAYGGHMRAASAQGRSHYNGRADGGNEDRKSTKGVRARFLLYRRAAGLGNGEPSKFEGQIREIGSVWLTCRELAQVAVPHDSHQSIGTLPRHHGQAIEL